MHRGKKAKRCLAKGKSTATKPVSNWKTQKETKARTDNERDEQQQLRTKKPNKVGEDITQTEVAGVDKDTKRKAPYSETR